MRRVVLVCLIVTGSLCAMAGNSGENEKKYEKVEWQGESYWLLPDSVCACIFFSDASTYFSRLEDTLMDGKWIGFLDAQRAVPEFTGRIENGKQEGNWLRYSFDQNSGSEAAAFLLESWHFKDNHPSGYYLRFSPEGQVLKEKHYVNGRIEGDAWSFFPSGDTMIREYWVKNKLQWSIFLANGTDTANATTYLDSASLAMTKYGSHIPSDSMLYALEDRTQKNRQTGIYLRYQYGSPMEKLVFYKGLLIYVEKFKDRKLQAEGPCLGTNHNYRSRSRSWNPADPPFQNYNGEWVFYNNEGGQDHKKEYNMGKEDDKTGISIP